MACWDALATSQAGLARRRCSAGPEVEIASGVSLGIESEVWARLLGAGRPLCRRGLSPDQAEDRAGVGRVAIVKAVRDRHPDSRSRSTPTRPTPSMTSRPSSNFDDFDLLLIEQPSGPRRHRRPRPAPIPTSEDADLPRREHPLGRGRPQGDRPGLVPGDQHQGQPGRRASRGEAGSRPLSVSRGVPVWCGGMHEFGIGRAANVAIASLLRGSPCPATSPGRTSIIARRSSIRRSSPIEGIRGRPDPSRDRPSNRLMDRIEAPEPTAANWSSRPRVESR